MPRCQLGELSFLRETVRRSRQNRARPAARDCQAHRIGSLIKIEGQERAAYSLLLDHLLDFSGCLRRVDETQHQIVAYTASQSCAGQALNPRYVTLIVPATQAASDWRLFRTNQAFILQPRARAGREPPGACDDFPLLWPQPVAATLSGCFSDA